MKIGGPVLIVLLFGAAAAGAWQAGFSGGAAFLCALGFACLFLWARGNGD